VNEEAMRTLIFLFVLLSGSQGALAQTGPRLDPADPSAPAPRPSYQPAFSDYQPFRDEPVRSWKEVNKEVADNPGMGSMKHGSGAAMPGMDSKTGDAAKGKEGHAGHDMGSMKDKPGMAMPGKDAKTGDAAKGKEGHAGHDMGSMKEKPGVAMPRKDAKTGDAAKGKEGHAGHDMGSMKDKPRMAMPGKDAKAGDARKGTKGTAGHDMGSMKHKPGEAMPGMDQPAATAPMNKEGHHTMAMAKPQSAPGQTAIAPTSIAGSGVVQSIDKANGKVKLTHEPIAAMGWPKMTLFFRLKERSLSDQVKEGDRIEFTLEKSTSGYVISGFRKLISESSPTADAPKPAGHGKH
jgi:Cu/Ag efflux protein CusF